MVKSMLKLIIPSLFFKCKIQFSLGLHSGFSNYQQEKEILSFLTKPTDLHTWNPKELAH